MTEETLKPIFPWFGGKRWVANDLWRYLGADTRRYIEPFAGSLSVLLGRPGGPRHRWAEVANDKYGHICNAWRAVQRAPEEVASLCAQPLHEAELHAQTARLRDKLPALQAALIEDCSYYDPELAGWWLWAVAAHLTPAVITRPHVRGKPGRNCCGVHHPPILSSLSQVFDRLRNVQILCGDFARCITDCYLDLRKGETSVYLDPPYDCVDHKFYGPTEGTVWRRTVDWVLAHHHLPRLKVVLSGYLDSTGQVELEAAGLTRLHLAKSKGRGGFGQQSHRETIWVNAAALRQAESAGVKPGQIDIYCSRA